MERKIVCTRCGGEFLSGARGSLPQFCSFCRPIVYKERHYKYEKKPVRKVISNCSLFYKLLLQNVLERDNHTCQKCGSKDNLDIHHKDGKSYHKVKGEVNHDLTNLITLCHKCHMQIHCQKADPNRLIAYYEKYPHMSYAALGRVFKISRERVRQIITEHGFSR